MTGRLYHIVTRPPMPHLTKGGKNLPCRPGKINSAALRVKHVFLLSFLLTGTAAAQDKIPRWHDNLERGAAAARDSGKPLFVVFRCVR
jgi:hypothetical protein